MTSIKGIAASSGIAIAKAYQLQTPDLSFEKKTIDNPENEIERLNKALEISKSELEQIKEHTKAKLGDEHAEIFSAHLLILNDPEMINPMKEKINTEHSMAETALEEVSTMFVEMFQNMDNE